MDEALTTGQELGGQVRRGQRSDEVRDWAASHLTGFPVAGRDPGGPAWGAERRCPGRAGSAEAAAAERPAGRGGAGGGAFVEAGAFVIRAASGSCCFAFASVEVAQDGPASSRGDARVGDGGGFRAGVCAVRGSRPVPKGRLAGLRVLEPHGPLRITSRGEDSEWLQGPRRPLRRAQPGRASR